jgi:hypothetical protein
MEGAIMLDQGVIQDVREQVTAVLAATPKRPQIGYAA